MAQYKIIVAEDDTVLRDLYLRKFDKSVYDVRTAINGEEAIKLVNEEKPDLMLLDINMPVLDGFAVLEKFPPAQRGFKIVLLTNFDDQANRDRGAKLGVSDYFVKKDMTIRSLLEMVQRLLNIKA